MATQGVIVQEVFSLGLGRNMRPTSKLPLKEDYNSNMRSWPAKGSRPSALLLLGVKSWRAGDGLRRREPHKTRR